MVWTDPDPFGQTLEGPGPVEFGFQKLFHFLNPFPVGVVGGCLQIGTTPFAGFASLSKRLFPAEKEVHVLPFGRLGSAGGAAENPRCLHRVVKEAVISLVASDDRLPQ